mgnify:CR=1 FL=1
MPVELVDQVSPESQTLKYFIKMPLVFTIGTAAMMSGLTIMFMKLITELGESGEFFSHGWLVFAMCWGMGSSGAF